MNKSINVFAAVLVINLLFTGFRSVKADSFDDICRFLQTSDVPAVSRHFGNTVELSMIGEEGIYSKTQAELILKDFLTKNPAKAVSVSHRGTSGSDRSYAIASYTAQNGTSYRVTIYTRVVKGQMTIQELKFEKS